MDRQRRAASLARLIRAASRGGADLIAVRERIRGADLPCKQDGPGVPRTEAAKRALPTALATKRLAFSACAGEA
jgi:hypothetical protein